VLPVLRDKHDDGLLKELLSRWQNHKVMVRWLSRFFNYLDRYYIQRHNLHSLNDVGLLVFRGAACWGLGGWRAGLSEVWQQGIGQQSMV
jgi:hypothetical protein